MRLNKKFTINKYINMKCCWRSIAVINESRSGIEDISVVDNEYLDFDISNCMHKFLGEGHYGKCYKITMNGKDYTCKKINYLKNNKFNKEITILKNINKNDYLPEFFISFSNLNSHYILYNYIPGNDLFQSLKNGYFELHNKNKVLKVITQINNGLFELFNNNLVHLDIKLENIILTNKDPIKIKIIDLESCQRINRRKNTYCGTAGYASPEMLLQNKYYYNTDIWSLGIVLFMLYTHDNFICKNITTNSDYNWLSFFEKYNHTYIKNKLLESNSYDEDIFELLRVMLHKLHVYRISIHSLKKHRLLQI
tara:strand:+ start:205 stop:1131 length:927 start_codon:yes stop_codon:yes gene_type:complete